MSRFETVPIEPLEMWSSDGTPAGTRIEADLMPGAASGVDRFDPGITVAANMLVFSGKTPQHGIEPRKWVPGGAPPSAQVIARLVFYNNSAADGFNESADAADDNAIARDKVALLPGRAVRFVALTVTRTHVFFGAAAFVNVRLTRSVQAPAARRTLTCGAAASGQADGSPAVPKRTSKSSDVSDVPAGRVATSTMIPFSPRAKLVRLWKSEAG